MSKILKTMIREELKARFAQVDGGVFISAQGLDSEKTYSFRSALQARNVNYSVIRNAFARQAFIENGFPQVALNEVLQGPLGIVYTQEEGSAPLAAKAIAEWKREARDKTILWKGAFMEGEILGPEDAEALKDAPTKDQARAMLLGILQAPAQQLLAILREPGARVIYGLNAYQEKRAEAEKDAS